VQLAKQGDLSLKASFLPTLILYVNDCVLIVYHTSTNLAQNVTSLTRLASVNGPINQEFKNKGVHIVGYDLAASRDILINILRDIDVLISCITWEHLEDQLVWIEAAKQAGVKRFVPSEWVGPAPLGVIDIKDKVCNPLQKILLA